MEAQILRYPLAWKFVTCIAAVICLFSTVSAVYAAYNTDSLIGYWKLDETSGTSAVDSSGDGKTGTHLNTPTISTDIPTVLFTNTRSLSFDLNSSEYVSASAVRVEGNDAFTYSVWINTSDSTNDYRTILSEGRSSTDTPTFHLQMPSDGDSTCTTDDSFKVFLRDNANTDASMCSSSAYNNGSWHHVAVVQRTSSNREMYVDGVSVATNTTTLGSTTFNQVAIGALLTTSASQFFNGKIDDVRIYSRALSVAEVVQLAAGNHTTAIWDGSSGTNWETAANWDINAVPDPYTPSSSV